MMPPPRWRAPRRCRPLAAHADLVVLDAAHISSIEAEAAFADRLEAFVKTLEKDHAHG